MTPETLTRVYPEAKAGGFSRYDGTIVFYTRVNALLKESDVALDVGAGRGAFFYDDMVPFRKNLRMLKGKCSKVIGLDVSDSVRTNPTLDESHVISPDANFPLASASVDLIVCDSTFEHVSNPAQFESEIARVLKPGGWLCARTPNLFGHIGFFSKIIPERFHELVLNRMQPERKRQDVFPASYKMNSPRQVRKIFSDDRWDLVFHTWESEPPYAGNSYSLNKIAEFVLRHLPNGMASTLFIYARRRWAK
jgi:SAM-dependent methyltransferase